MPSKREQLEQLLDKNLTKTADQAKRENQSISSILKRFGGDSPETESLLQNEAKGDLIFENSPITPIISIPIDGIPEIGIPNTSTPISGTPKTGMPDVGMPETTIPEIDIPLIAMPLAASQGSSSQKRGPQPTPVVDTARGWLALPNDIIDKVLPTLSLPEQSVLIRMYRLSRGYGSDVCTIGYLTLGKLCNISRNTVKTAVKSLITSGLIECLEQGAGADHSTYKIKLPPAAVAKSGIPKIGRQKNSTPDPGIASGGVVADEIVESNPGVPAIDGIPADGPIKEIISSKEKIHTTQNVSVSSRFSLEECRRYADHLKQTGQGITNPGGYATKIFRSGEADTFIEAFLNPQAPINISKCPTCRGSNFVYIDASNPDRGVKPCRHEELLNQNL
jgi:hypothetical protein